MFKLFGYRKALEGKTSSFSDLIPFRLLAEVLTAREKSVTYC